MRRIIIAALLLAVALSINAQNYKVLNGEYVIAGKTIIDPPTDEAHDTHMYFELTGNAARDLYNKLKVAPVADRCGEKGGLLKNSGALQCTRTASGKTHTCHFAIDIANQRLADGGAC